MLDINVLIALLDSAHPGHAAASYWFDRHYTYGWLTCPLTQNGCIRILSQPSYPRPLSVAAAIERIRAAASTEYHLFIPDDVSLLDTARVDPLRLSGYRQLTDAYLLAMAVAHDARLVTLDTRIPLAPVHGADETHLVMI